MGAHDVDPSAPPPVPVGCAPAAPDFVGLGVQKAGTTWWYDTIAAHRLIHSPSERPKELHFFDRYWAEPFGSRDVELYARWFARPPGTLAGEWTPRYLHDWWVPPLVTTAAPAARYLVVLRDPVERYASGVAHELRSRGRRDPTISDDALQRSRYAHQLERLLELVPHDQVLVQQFERCVVDPVGERGRVWSHLGLEGDPEAAVPPPTNITGGARPELPSHVQHRLRQELRDDLAQLAKLPFELDLDLWPSASRTLGDHA